MRVTRRWLAASVAFVPLLVVPTAQASPASVVRTDRASIFVLDPSTHTRADLLLSRSGGSVTYQVNWSSQTCNDNGTTTLCAYTERDGQGIAPAGTVTIAALLGGATVTALPVAYTQTDFTILSTDDGSKDDVFSEPVITSGSTTIDGSLSPAGKAQTTVGRSADGGVVTVDVARFRGAAPTLSAFGSSFGSDSDDGSQLSSDQVTTTS